ncbi:ATP-binding protein [Sulfitobacter guttiformis]|uniref:histidine kinase n=1 Tax=Sulfitobacter guttiformis TaxID=74349 RepID=J7G4M8_9RHOB|nr:ATP-binding protein [Sulfitobacter guttiformis]AFP55401.1 multi-sensor hybrid histidine kinase [Sulfitobacter guttiformis]KIN75557.1 Multi-sensor hybrid histidine kinase [Sulfitobacter guttiformis KCTC 32187]RKE91034.1 signal transduction histidine kinase [Sulfitobacter guttiformis]
MQRRNNDRQAGISEAATLRTLNAFAVDLITIPTVEDLFWYVAQNVVGPLSFVDCVIYQANDEQTELVQVAAMGEKNPFGRSILNPLKIPFGSGITGQVAKSRTPMIVDDLSLDENYISDTSCARSEICVPIVCGNRVVGIIDSEHPKKGAFGPAELEVLITIAALTAAKLELLAEADRSKQRYHDLVEAHAELSREATNRKALEAELFNARKMEAVGRLTGRFAHEFNNLMTVISGNLEFLEHDVPEGGPRETLKAAQDAAARGGVVIDSMLAFSQRTRLSPQRVDLNDILRAYCADPKKVAQDEVVMILGEGLHSVELDPEVFEKVMGNLLGNARDAMAAAPGRGDRIAISTRNTVHDLSHQRPLSTNLAAGNYVRLSVSDTGVGITHDRLHQIFDPFFTTKQVGEGKGLGLSMVLGFMQQSGGTVDVVSDAREGSVFHLYFPAK